MKKTVFFLMSLCALAFLSCQKEEMGGGSEGTYTYVLNGAAGPETKINVGAMTSAGWPIRWATGDVVEVFKAGDAASIGKASLADGYNGQTHGQFALTTANTYTGNVVIAHGTGITYADGVVSAKVSAEQEVISSGNSGHIGKNGLAYATAAMKGTDVPVDFVLDHKSAYVRLVINTTEFAEHTLLGATLWSKGAALAGTLSADVQTGEVSVKSSADYVKASVRQANVAAFGSQAVIWFSTLPVDLTGKSLYVIVHMTKGISTVTVPVQIPGGNLKGGSVNTITIKDLKTSSAPAWYETVETRYIANNGKSWSYGPENTVLAYVDSGAKTVEFKARGDFRYVVEPKYIQFKYGHDINLGDGKKTLVDGSPCYDGSTYPEFGLDENYSVDITVGEGDSYNGHMAGLYVKDAQKNIIWGTNVWAVREVKEIAYTNGTVLDRNLGSGSLGNANDIKAGMIVFQWGRPFAFGYSNNTIADIVACSAVTSLAVQAANPYTFYKYDGVTYSDGSSKPNDWWYGTGVKSDSNHINDLWGNPSTSGSGVKSNYDPCPKGYRVASPAILNEVMQDVDLVKNANCYALNFKDKDWWAFTRLRWGDTGNRLENNTRYVTYWSNGAETVNAYCMYAEYKDNQLTTFATGKGRAAAFAVRCMKDTENR